MDSRSQSKPHHKRGAASVERVASHRGKVRCGMKLNTAASRSVLLHGSDSGLLGVRRLSLRASLGPCKSPTASEENIALLKSYGEQR